MPRVLGIISYFIMKIDFPVYSDVPFCTISISASLESQQTDTECSVISCEMKSLAYLRLSCRTEEVKMKSDRSPRKALSCLNHITILLSRPGTCSVQTFPSPVTEGAGIPPAEDHSLGDS